MLRFKLLYGITLLGLFWFAIMYLDELAMLLFIMASLLPFLLFLLHRITAPFLSMTIESPDSIVTNKSDYYFYLTANNRSYFPVPFCIATIEIRNQLLGTVENKKCRFSIGSHQTTMETISYAMPVCSGYELCLKEVTIYSFLSLFKKRCFPKTCIESIRLPDVKESIPLPEIASSLPNKEGDLFSKDKAGDDVSELFSLREFRDGDSLHRIHWKLSSKMDDFIVKEYSFPFGADVTIVFDAVKERTDDFIPRLEETLSFTLSLCLSFLELGTHSTFVWYDKQLNHQRKSNIETKEQCYRVFYELLKTPLLETSIQPSLSLEVLEKPYIRIVSSPFASFIVENTYES